MAEVTQDQLENALKILVEKLELQGVLPQGIKVNELVEEVAKNILQEAPSLTVEHIKNDAAIQKSLCVSLVAEFTNNVLPKEQQFDYKLLFKEFKPEELADKEKLKKDFKKEMQHLLLNLLHPELKPSPQEQKKLDEEAEKLAEEMLFILKKKEHDAEERCTLSEGSRAETWVNFISEAEVALRSRYGGADLKQAGGQIFPPLTVSADYIATVNVSMASETSTSAMSLRNTVTDTSPLSTKLNAISSGNVLDEVEDALNFALRDLTPKNKPHWTAGG